jgi:hypothetical protein
MDLPHDGDGTGSGASREPPADELAPRDDDERFIVGLVLTYYRRHPQRARTRLLDLLGEVLTSPPEAAGARASAPASAARPQTTAPPTPADDPKDLWRRTQAGVAPLKPKR